MPKPKQLAIDIVLPLPAPLRDRVIKLNKRACALGLASRALGKNDFVPHISLAMGGVKIKNLADFKQKTKNIIKKFQKKYPAGFKVNIIGQVKHGKAKSFLLSIAKSAALKTLHHDLMTDLKKYFSYNCAKVDLYFKRGEKKFDPDYINLYRARFSFKKFYPHITIHTSAKLPFKLPISFKAKQLSAFQIGVSTTCRKHLFSVKLAPPKAGRQKIK